MLIFITKNNTNIYISAYKNIHHIIIPIKISLKVIIYSIKITEMIPK